MNKQITIITVFIALAIGVGSGYWLGSGKVSQTMDPKSNVASARKPLFYRNPMNPDVTSPVPAKDEMGMDYVPVYADSGNSSDTAGTVKIDPVTVQNIGVRTTKAEQRVLSRSIRAVGRVEFNEERLTRLHPKTQGWIEKLYTDKTGSAVKKDDILLSIYSPQLVSSQEEYLLALKNKQVLADSPFKEIRQGAIDLAKTSYERLQLLDVPEHQIRELEQSQKIKKNIHIHSPYDGIVMKIGIREGQYVTPKTELYMLADLSKVWVYVDVYEYELPWVKVGDRVEMKLTGVIGRTFNGRIGFIYPYAEAKTRTVKVRLEFDNSELLLKPDMFAEVTIHASRQVDAIVIPSQAVVRSGNREQVFIVREPGKFEPREVKLGISADGMIQVLEGVKVGEEVVASALFLIDSESKLREATAKMLEAASTPASTENVTGDDSMNHDSMSMDSMDHDSMDMDSINKNKGNKTEKEDSSHD